MTQKQEAFVPLSELMANFEEVVPALKPKEAIDEANRCLYCYDAPCIKACPTSIDIPSFIKKIATGNLLGSARTIMEANPVGASCSRVCPTSELCEGACVLNGEAASKAIQIGLLQRHATDWARESGVVLFKAGANIDRRVAVIGAGPAGLSAARELAVLGYEVSVYEAKEKGGGLNTYGIVSFRLPEDVPQWEVDQVEALGVKFHYGVRVGEGITPDALLAKYDAVVLAVGMAAVPKLGIPCENLDGVLDAIALVEETKTQPLTDRMIGKKVVVIGAGNTAIDAATCSKRLGADQVQILYRRTQAEMTAYAFEYEFAKQDGVEFRWLVAPTRILADQDGHVSGLELVRMKLGEPDAKGRKKPSPIEGSEFTIDADYVVTAIGQDRHLQLLEQFGLAHERGIPIVDGQTYQTSRTNVFAAGDVIFGGGKHDAMVVEAAQQGKEVAHRLHDKWQHEAEA